MSGFGSTRGIHNLLYPSFEMAVGDDIMAVLIGGDIRPHVVDALQFLVGTLKKDCVTERELN